MSPKAFERPVGFQDVSPTVALKKRELENRLTSTFIHWGYQEVVTPMVEYAETVGQASAIAEEKMLKLIGGEGAMLVLRPDQTAPIARMVNSLLKKEPLPLRLFYHASVFRTQEQAAGRRAELFQSGVELVGDGSPAADAELIALAITSLKVCQSTPFRIVVGHIGLIQGLLQYVCPEENLRLDLIHYLSVRDYVGFEQLLYEIGNKEDIDELLQICRGIDKESLQSLCSHPSKQVAAAAEHLQQIWEIIMDYGFDSYLSLDIRLLGNLDYYTGIYLEGYADGVGFSILSGGRYDQLYGQFGRALPATGFAFKMNNLLSTCQALPQGCPDSILLYPLHLRKQAIERASQLREMGQNVVLQADENQTEIKVVHKEAREC